MIVRKSDPPGNKQGTVDRNHDRVERVGIQADQNVLQWREDEQDPKQGAMVASPGRSHGDEFAQRPEGDQPKQHHGHGLIEQQCYNQDHANCEPGHHTFVEISNDCGVEVGLGLASQDIAGDHHQTKRHQYHQNQNDGWSIE